MLKKMFKSAMLVSALLLAAVSASAAEGGHFATESGWFDMANCDFCKNLIEDPGLLPHTTWENFKTESGMVNITSVAPEYKESGAKAMKAMQDLGQKIHSGQVSPMSVKTCGHCREYGMLMMAGVKLETVNGSTADVTLMTADDPALVERIHAWVDRDNEEMARMMGGGGHEGHEGHGH